MDIWALLVVLTCASRVSCDTTDWNEDRPTDELEYPTDLQDDFVVESTSTLPPSTLQPASAVIHEEVTFRSDVGVARYLGLGYDLMRANPFSVHLDPGLKSGSLKPAKLLKTFFEPQAKCPLLTQCLHVRSTHEQKIFVNSTNAYQKAVARHLRIFGKSTTNISDAIGIADNALETISHQISDGNLLLDIVSFNVSEEAELDFRASRVLYAPLLTAFCELPEDYNHDEYLSFVKEFGTHVVVKVRLAQLGVERMTISPQIIYQTFLDLGLPVNTSSDGNSQFGYLAKTISGRVLSRLIRDLVANKTSGAGVTTDSGPDPIPVVTAVREIPYFFTRERILESNSSSSACRDLIGEDSHTSSKLERSRLNLERAVVDYAAESKAEHAALSEQPEFIAWPSQINNELRSQLLKPKAIQTVSCYTQSEASFLGKGYDIFRADPYSSQMDPGFHLTPDLLSPARCDGPGASCASPPITCSNVGGQQPEPQVKNVVDISGDQIARTEALRFLDPLPNIAASLISKLAPAAEIIETSETITPFPYILSKRMSKEIALDYRNPELPLDSRFVRALCALPLTYSKSAFMGFLKEFGTHVTVKIRYGSLTKSQSHRPGAVVQDDSRDHVDFTELLGEVDDAFIVPNGRNGDSSLVVFNKTSTPLVITLKDIGYFVTRQRIISFSTPPECSPLTSSDTNLATLRGFINQALLDYGEEVAPVSTPAPAATEETTATSAPLTEEVTTTSASITMTTRMVSRINTTVPIRNVHPTPKPTRKRKPYVGWPTGNYGLLEAASGCPEGNWQTGHRFQDSEDTHNRNRWSSGFEQKTSSRLTSEGVHLTFCVKTAEFSSEEPSWPAGSYCIFKKGSCPWGFSISYVDHDDEDHRNGNSADGMLPDGFYTEDTRFYFCCREDGDPDHPISLPTAKPFFLLQAGTECQHVRGMDAEPLWLFTDCEDNFLGCRMSIFASAHPGLTSLLGDWQWHFCYYKANSKQLDFRHMFDSPNVFDFV